MFPPGKSKRAKKNPILVALENPATTANTLINLQDPIMETPENLAMTVDTLVNLQDLQEPIATSSAINPSQEKMHYISEPFTSSFPCTILIFCLLLGLEPLRVALV
jgi:hypothetical protein